MSDKKAVAWMVSDDDEGCATVVFHHHGPAARRMGCGEVGSEFEYCTAKRAPQFDQYAEQNKVPQMALLEDGWWLSCHHCQHQIREEERDEDENTPLDQVVVIGDSVFCNQQCKESQDSEKQKSNEAFEVFKKKVQAARPDLEFTDFEGEWPWITKTACFQFPGSQYGGSVRSDDGEIQWSVANGDKAAWQEYEQSRLN